MHQTTILSAAVTPAGRYAEDRLRQLGFSILREPRWDLRHLLLDVPSFQGNLLRSGENPDTLFSSLPPRVTVWGGNLSHPALEGFDKRDLLQDEAYLKENAAITADCALNIAEEHIRKPWDQISVLILGWGRIGKCLARSLKAAGSPVSVAARRPEHIEALTQLEFGCGNLDDFLPSLDRFHLIFNTVPTLLLPEEELRKCRNCVKIDLASIKGMESSDVIWARALPGRCAPERSGTLIAQTIARLMEEERE